jgi:hypothetical protein
VIIPTEVVKEHRRKRTREEAATDQAQQAGPSKKMTPCKDTGAMKTIAKAIIKNIRLVLFEPTTRLHKKRRTRRTRNSNSNK